MHCSGHFKPILVYKGDRFKKGFRQSGNDRDEYVANNNGGFTVAHAPSTQLKPSTMYVAGYSRGFNSLGIDRTVRNNVKAHQVIYRQNGTGRDTYILSNNGGFAIQEGSNKFCGYQQDFKRSLRQYPPAEPRMQKSVSSVSPVRYKSIAGSFSTTLNRFKIYMKQRGESVDAMAGNAGAAKGMQERDLSTDQPQPAQTKQKMGHYRTQSQQITQETTERIKDYLQQRQAYSRAQALHNSLSQNSTGANSNGRQGSHSCGRLQPNERMQSNPRSRNVDKQGLTSVGAEIKHAKTRDEAQASLVLAVKSTPSLNNAFTKKMSQTRTTGSKFFNTANQEMPTGPSEVGEAPFDRRTNLNVLSHEDLGDPSLESQIHQMERSRPQTTRFADRRLTHQPQQADTTSPFAMQIAQDIDQIYQRHGSPEKTAMQAFEQHQQLTCARLSVPHERRRRERFSGTQNSFMYQTVGGCENAAGSTTGFDVGLQNGGTATTMRKTVFDGPRRNSNASMTQGQGIRVKSSLMGTSARQKLLKLKLQAHQVDNAKSNDQKAQIANQIEELSRADAVPGSNEFDHIKGLTVNLSKDNAKTKKERLLELAYKTVKPAQRTPSNASGTRQTLKANLRQNMRQQSKRNTETNGFNRRHQSMTGAAEQSATKELNRSSLV